MYSSSVVMEMQLETAPRQLDRLLSFCNLSWIGRALYLVCYLAAATSPCLTASETGLSRRYDALRAHPELLVSYTS